MKYASVFGIFGCMVAMLKINSSKWQLSKREKAQSSMQQEDKLKCVFSLIGTMDMGSLNPLSLIYGDYHVIDKVHTIVMF